jgi:hypothetical protein
VPFDGLYPDPNGRRFNLRRASKESRLTVSFLKHQLAKSPYLPEGKLPSELKCPPQQRYRSQDERTVLEEDLNRLKTGIRTALETDQPGMDWKDADDLSEHYGIQTLEERIFFGGLLREARRSKCISALRAWRLHGGGRRRVYFYYVREVVDYLRGLPQERQDDEPAGGTEVDARGSAGAVTPLRAAVTLGGLTEPILVRGKEKPPLPKGTYRVVKALLDVFPAGLVKDKLATRADYTDPHKLLATLCEDPDWAAAIFRPGRGYRGGYRILAW